MINFFVRFFDRLEDRVRSRLSHRSILYAFIGGSLTVMFWRAIWHTSDKIMYGESFSDMFNEASIILKTNGFWGLFFYEPFTLIWTVVFLLITGLFVSIMIGDRIIISGIKHEKRVDEKTKEEIEKEEIEIKSLVQKFSIISKDLEEIKELLKR
jgi:hypothetical protein